MISIVSERSASRRGHLKFLRIFGVELRLFSPKAKHSYARREHFKFTVKEISKN